MQAPVVAPCTQVPEQQSELDKQRCPFCAQGHTPFVHEPTKQSGLLAGEHG
jgi:hypothetical protein